MKDELRWIVSETKSLETEIKLLRKDVELLASFIEEDTMNDNSAYFYSGHDVFSTIDRIEETVNDLKDDVDHLKERVDNYDKDMELNEDYITYLINLKTPMFNKFVDFIKKKIKC